MVNILGSLIVHNLIFQVFEKLKEAQVTSKDIDKLRDGYRPAAKRGAVLFFILADMAAINAMYQYSLSSYLEVFNYSLKKSLPDSHLPKRLKNIMDTLTHNVYNYACTGESLNIVLELLTPSLCLPTAKPYYIICTNGLSLQFY